MHKLRLCLAVIFYLDMWYLPVYVAVSIASLLWKLPLPDPRWSVSLVSVSLYPIVQYARCRAGMTMARKFSDTLCSGVSVSSVPIVLVQLLLFSRQQTKMIVESSAGVIALTLSFIESLLLIAFFGRNHSWTSCTPTALFRLVIVAGPLTVVILSLIIYLCVSLSFNFNSFFLVECIHVGAR